MSLRSAARDGGRGLDRLVEACHRSLAASWPEDHPHEPAPPLRAWRVRVLEPWSGEPTCLLVAEGPAGEVTGHAVIELPERDNRHVGMVEIHVDAARRRQGHGDGLGAPLLSLRPC